MLPQKVQEIDLTEISTYMQKQLGFTIETTHFAETLYRQFLALKLKYKDKAISPPQLADHFWHAHMIHSKKYMADCDALFGSYLHHTPGEEDTTQWNSSVSLYMQEFGVNLQNAQLATCN